MNDTTKLEIETETVEQSQEGTEETHLTVEVPTELQAGLAKVCTCPPGCCGCAQ
jgi:hypothetical protein